MTFLKLILISGFMMVGTTSAFANNGSFNPTQSVYSAAHTGNASATQYTAQKARNQNALRTASTRSIRIVREPIPGQNRVIKSTNNRGLVIMPNSTTGKMRLIKPSKTNSVKSSMPNLFIK